MSAAGEQEKNAKSFDFERASFHLRELEDSFRMSSLRSPFEVLMKSERNSNKTHFHMVSWRENGSGEFALFLSVEESQVQGTLVVPPKIIESRPLLSASGAARLLAYQNIYKIKKASEQRSQVWEHFLEEPDVISKDLRSNLFENSYSILC